MFKRFAVLAVLSIPFAAAAWAHEPIGDGAKDLPIFDAHVHYKEDAWGPYPPATIIQIMDRKGVAMALVSSTPDAGTIKLFEYAPNRILPSTRAYEGGYGPSNWTTWPEVVDYLRGRLGKYDALVGIGEFHVHGVDGSDSDVLKAVARLAVERDVLVHVHSDFEPVEFFFKVEPDIRIIWAHAGMVTPPDVVMRMMDTYKALWADLSYREHEIVGRDGKLDPAWEALLTKHADRFMVGTDTWVNEQWERYGDLIARNRAWIAHFPKELAEKFAFRNAEALFGVKVSRDQLGTR